MEFSSLNTMAYIIHFCRTQETPVPVNSTKAQKLLYCCYGAVLADSNERLTDEHPRAWMYGPVFPDAYRAVDKKRLTAGMARQFARECPEETLALVDRTLTTFGKYTSQQLSAWAGMKDSPWAKADPLAALDDREIGLFFKPYLAFINKVGNPGASYEK